MVRANGDARKLDTIKKICRATKLEVEKKLMGQPLSETELRRKYGVDGKLTCRIIPRFAVSQGMTDKRCELCDLEPHACDTYKGQQMRKLRCCDNAKASSTNDNTRMWESIASPTFEFPARICAHVTTRCANSKKERTDVVLGLDDLFPAFRRVSSSQPQF